MIELTLTEQIHHFVRTIRLVKESQIYQFFRDHDKEDIAYEIKHLKKRGYLHKHENDLISTIKYLHAPVTAYSGMQDAAIVLTGLASKEVLWICEQEYPMELCYGTVNGSVYSVTAFTDNWQIKYGLTRLARKNQLPPGEEDTTKYIAVVRDFEVMEKIVDLGFYRFVMINPDGTVDHYEPPEE